MATSREIYLSVLALDAYNRGYNSGLTVDGNQVGRAQVVSDDFTLAQRDRGFYATAYDVSNVTSLGGAHTVVSYRGTDFSPASQLLADVIYGWAAAAGNFSSYSQVPMAIDFYESVVRDRTSQSGTIYEFDPAGVIATGHSLGGGLAGIVSSLAGGVGVGFDHMPFGYVSWLKYLYDYIASVNGVADTPTPDWSQFSALHADGEILEAARSGLLQGALGAVALFAGVLPVGVYGAILAAATNASEGSVSNPGLRSFDFEKFSNAVALHSQNLLVMLQFA